MSMKQMHPSESEPLWKDEFSIESAQETLVNRRQFAKFLTLTSLAMFVGNLWILLQAWLYKQPLFPRQTVAKAADIPIGSVKLFHYPGAGDPCIMVRTGQDDFFAYSQKCTHLSCLCIFRQLQKDLNVLAMKEHSLLKPAR